MATKNYTFRFVNKNFLIKVFGYDASGRKINKLVGCSGCIDLIGEELFDKFVTRALKAGQDACYCKLRRGLLVTFYAH